jgi:AcrR family transcriptional regulator
MKRQRTRAAIQEAGLRLFAEQGYDRTTCEQVAAAAEVSPATFYRYFPTKEDVVLSDDYDELLATLTRARPAHEPPIRAVRGALAVAFGAFSDDDTAAVRERLQLVLSVPALRARRYEQARATEAVLGHELAPRLGASPTDLEVKVTVAAIVAALIVGLEQWAQDGGRLADHVDDALRILENRRPSRSRR